ncbi:hypothetical protein Ocin01_08236 [Orchesella cincta]|uniref:Uncharacterized protein n=1 Tax=Orchesella cincta TaxID=48709 RepID=A0A1D2N064_ORCCI|nr:hypothetical protein Ocin01_08236 [Orchesella cincta]
MYVKVQKVLQPLKEDLTECKCVERLINFLEAKKVLKASDMKHFAGISSDSELVDKLVEVLKKRDSAQALKVVEDFLKSDGTYAAARVKFAESWINEKNRRKIGNFAFHRLLAVG